MISLHPPFLFSNMGRFFKRTIITLAIILVVLPICVTLVVSSQWFRPKINEICTSFVQDGKIEMDTISLSLFEEFPYLSLKLSDGVIHSYAFEGEDTDSTFYKRIPDKAKTPLKFKEFVVSVNIPQLLFGKVNIKRVRIVEPEIFAFVTPWGKANWDIFGSDTTETSDSEFNLNLGIKRFGIRDANVTYFDTEQKVYYKGVIGGFFTKGNISLDPEKIELKFGRMINSSLAAVIRETGTAARVNIDSLVIQEGEEDYYRLAFASKSDVTMESKSYTTGLPFNFKGGLGVDISDPSNIDIDSLIIGIAGSPIILDGRASFQEDNIFTNINCDIPKLSFGEILSYLNTEAFPQFEGISTNLTMSLNAQALGRYDLETGRPPAVTADIKIPNGKLIYPGLDIKVNDLGFDGHLNYDPYIVDSTSLAINSINLDATGIILNGKGKGTNMLKDPNFDLKFKGSANLTELSEIFLSDAGINTKGDMTIDLTGKFKSSDLSLAGIGNTHIRGRFHTDNLLVELPQDTIFAMLKGVTVNFGSTENKRDTLMAQNAKTLRVSFRADSADVNYKEVAKVQLSKARASVKSAAEGVAGDTTAIHPLMGNINAERLGIITKDSLRVRGYKLQANARMLPSKKDSLVPVLTFNTNANRLAYRDKENFFTLRNGDIAFDATLQEAVNKERRNDPARVVRRERLLDSLSNVYPGVPRDSLLAMNRKSRRVVDELGDEGNIDMSMDKNITDLLEKWNANCHIKGDGGRIITPYFPLRNSFDNINLDINTNEIKMEHTVLHAGSSSLDLSGRIWGIKRAITRKGKLRGDIMLQSDTLNVNELLNALNAASEYLAAGDSFKDSLVRAESEEELDALITQEADTTLNTSSVIIPGNIDMKLALHVGYGKYSNLVMDDISGELLAKNRTLRINNFNAITEAGDLSLSALYSTKSKDDIHTGFDLELNNVQVDKLISIIPSVDTLLPMLRSFEGILNCELAATAKMDTAMNILLPSLNGVARIKGKDLVLLDGETFTKIAKMLRFKNKDENIIDSISVEMLMSNNKIEMFPFLLKMDRYQAAASGVQNLDMSFNYHISVIKSPLPLRLGVNIMGNFDDMKFKLGKPKYKNANIPSYTKVIDESRINLRKSIIDIFDKGTNNNITNIEVVKRDSTMIKDLEVTPVEELSEEENAILKEEGIIPKPAADKPAPIAVLPEEDNLLL